MSSKDISIDVFEILDDRNIKYELNDQSYFDGFDDIYIIKINQDFTIKLLQNVEKINGEYIYDSYTLYFSYSDKDPIYGYDNIIEFIKNSTFKN